jgi:acyl-CoA synthetase (NDP forming)
MVEQAGGIFVEHSEEFWDMMHLFSVLKPYQKITRCEKLGLIIPGGGNSVEGTDLFTRYGFEVPELSQATQEKLSTLIPPVNTSVKNPVDLGATGTLERVFLNSIKYIAEDPEIDCVIHYQPIDWVARTEEEFGGKGYAWAAARSLGRLAKNKLQEPLIQLMPILNLDERVAKIYRKFIEILRKRGVPNFTSMHRLAIALKKFNEYVDFLEQNQPG